MRKSVILLALSAGLCASPALARDGAGYFGIEGGVLIPRDTRISIYDDAGNRIGDDFLRVNHKSGWDADLIAGYDFGAVRAEVELGHKRAGVEKIEVESPLAAVDDGEFDGDGRVKATSLMANVLLDFGNEDGVSFFVGGGLGLARVRYHVASDEAASDLNLRLSDRALAGQVIAGVRTMVSEGLDIGLKYRYFQTRKLNFGLGDGDFVDEARGRFASHSLLASVIFNFGAPPAAIVAPPVVVAPPPPPATQTCPDGSVILATDACPAPAPAPYVPPPAPEPTPERG